MTFFEVLIGRTPFEYLENERLTTKEQLERYWGRSVSELNLIKSTPGSLSSQIRGSWVGSWKMTTGIEKLLRRMVTPNADLRCTASAAMKDPYWTQSRAEDAQISTNRTAHSHSGSIRLKSYQQLLTICNSSREICQHFTCADRCRCAQDEGRYSFLVFTLQQGEFARLSSFLEDSHSGRDRQFGEREVPTVFCSRTVQRFAACAFSISVPG